MTGSRNIKLFLKNNITSIAVFTLGVAFYCTRRCFTGNNYNIMTECIYKHFVTNCTNLSFCTSCSRDIEGMTKSFNTFVCCIIASVASLICLIAIFCTGCIFTFVFGYIVTERSGCDLPVSRGAGPVLLPRIVSGRHPLGADGSLQHPKQTRIM